MKLSFEEAIDQHREMHAKGKKVFSGYSLRRHIPDIASLVDNSNIKTLLDYGCGKAQGWEKENYQDRKSTRLNSSHT